MFTELSLRPTSPKTNAPTAIVVYQPGGYDEERENGEMHDEIADSDSGELESLRNAFTARSLGFTSFEAIAFKDNDLRPEFDTKPPLTFGEQSKRHVPFKTPVKEAHFSIVVNGSIIINGLGGIDPHHDGVESDDDSGSFNCDGVDLSGLLDGVHGHDEYPYDGISLRDHDGIRGFHDGIGLYNFRDHDGNLHRRGSFGHDKDHRDGSDASRSLSLFDPCCVSDTPNNDQAIWRFADDHGIHDHDEDPFVVDDDHGVGLDGPNWRCADDYGAPSHDEDPCAVDDGQWNQEEFYYDDQEEDIDIYDITEHDDEHDDGRDFDDDD